jgi:SPP1 gp7 family putative phage head morphogenesis protein
MTRKVLGNGDPLEYLLPDLGAADLRLAELVRDCILRALIAGIRTGAGEIGIEPSFDVLNPEVTQFVSEYTGLLANRVNRTFVEQVREALLEGLNEGETFREMRDRILEAMGCQRNAAGQIIADKGAKYSANRIVRTEVSRAQNAGREAQLKQAGAKRKVWTASPDACPYCAELDGKTIEIDETFFRKGDVFTITDEEGGEHRLKLNYCDTPHPPLHPQCRCNTEYVW